MSNYVQDPDNSKKVVPGTRILDKYGTPETGSFVKTPSFVVVGGLTNEVGFFLEGSASFASKLAIQSGSEAEGLTPSSSVHGGLTGSEHYTAFGKPSAGSILNIHPNAWSGSATDMDNGQVTFVYSSGQQPR